MNRFEGKLEQEAMDIYILYGLKPALEHINKKLRRRKTIKAAIAFVVLFLLGFLLSCDGNYSPSSSDPVLELAGGDGAELSIGGGAASVTCENLFPRFPKIETAGELITLHYRIENSRPSDPVVLEVFWNRDEDTEPKRFKLGAGAELEGSIEHTYEPVTEPTEKRIRVDARLEGIAGGCGRGRTVTIAPASSPAAELEWDNPCYGGLWVGGFSCSSSPAGVKCRAPIGYLRRTEDGCSSSPAVTIRIYFWPDNGETGTVSDRRIVQEWIEPPFAPEENRVVSSPEPIRVDGPGRWFFLFETIQQRVWWRGRFVL